MKIKYKILRIKRKYAENDLPSPQFTYIIIYIYCVFHNLLIYFIYLKAIILIFFRQEYCIYMSNFEITPFPKISEFI